MIITIAIDTEDDKDGIDTLVRFVQSMESKKYLSNQKAAECTSLMETARRRSAGENVVYKEDAPAPKKRGRKPKAREEA